LVHSEDGCLNKRTLLLSNNFDALLFARYRYCYNNCQNFDTSEKSITCENKRNSTSNAGLYYKKKIKARDKQKIKFIIENKCITFLQIQIHKPILTDLQHRQYSLIVVSKEHGIFASEPTGMDTSFKVIVIVCAWQTINADTHNKKRLNEKAICFYVIKVALFRHAVCDR